MAHLGAADAYYNGKSDGSDKQYPMQPQMQYPPPAAGNDVNYQQPPPSYGQNYQSTGVPPDGVVNGKQSFNQVFKIDKPKYNDLWAGILVRSVPSVPRDHTSIRHTNAL